MGRHPRLSLICAFALLCNGVVHAGNDPVPVPANIAADIHVEGIKFVTPPEDAPQPSSLLMFAVVNESSSSVNDLVIAITVREMPEAEGGTSRALVGPFAVAGHATIEAGYFVEYALLLLNLMPDCRCQAEVKVMSARAASQLTR